MTLAKMYLDTSVPNKKIKLTVSFNREIRNWATNESKKIGYQVTAVPVEIIQREGYTTESYGAFTGFNDCLLEVNRQSSKRLERAVEIMNDKMGLYKKFFEGKGVIFPDL